MPYVGGHENHQLRRIDGISLDQESTAPPVALEQPISKDDDAASKRLPPRRLPDITESTNATDAASAADSAWEELPLPIGGSIELSLADARASALTSNLDLAVELVNPAIARQVASEEAAKFEATFTSSYVRNRVDPPPGVDAGGVPDTTFDRFSNFVTQPLVCGGEIRALHDVTKADVHALPLPNAVDTDLGLEYRQPLLRNFGYRVNTADIRIAQTDTAIADARSKLSAIRVLADVERAYWQLYAARQFYEITRQQLELANQQLDATRRLVKAEVFTKVEDLVAESGVLIRRDAAIRAETNVRLTERELKRIMQMPQVPVQSPIEIVLATQPNPLGLVFDRKNLSDRAIENRMEMLELQLQLLATSIDIDFQHNSVLPRLDLVAEMDALGLDSSYRKSMDNLFEGDFGDRLVGVVLEVPLSGNIGARARLRAAQLRSMQTRIEQRRVSVLIVQEVYGAIDRVEQNWQRIVATQQSRIAAERAYDGQVKLQEAGRQTVTDVLSALTTLGDARAQEVQAIVDYQIAKVDLAIAAGAMLGYGQVNWNPCRGASSALPAVLPDEPIGREESLPVPATELQFPAMVP